MRRLIVTILFVLMMLAVCLVARAQNAGATYTCSQPKGITCLKWVLYKPVPGPQGPQGIQGVPGPSIPGLTISSDGSTLTFTGAFAAKQLTTVGTGTMWLCSPTASGLFVCKAQP